MKKFRGILVLTVIMIGGLFFSPLISAQVSVPSTQELFETTTKENRKNSINLSETSNIRDYTDGSTEEGEIQMRTVMIKLTSFLKQLMIPIAILLLVYGGVELYLTHGNEEKYKQVIGQIAGIGTGFVLMYVAVNLVDWVFFGKEGEIFREGGNAIEFARRGMFEIVGLYDYLVTFVVVIAVAFIVWNAITLIVAGGEDEEQISNLKKRIIYSIIGIIIIISIKPMVGIITDPSGGLVIPSVFGGVSLIARWINFILGLIGVFAVIAIIYAGIRLIVNFGDEEATTQAKSIIMGAVIGLIITFSAWTIVNYVIAP